MASWDHEGIIELFRSDPRLAAELLERCLGQKLPRYSDASVEAGTLTQLNPAELRADLVISLNDHAGPILAIIVEAQREPDPEKEYSWPAYVGALHHRLRCPVCLLVVTQSERVANWAAQTIRLGPGSQVTPSVVGPRSVPVVTELGQARKSPELAVLSAMAHGAGDVDVAVQIAMTATAAAQQLDRDRFLLYFSLIQAALSEAARKTLRMLPQAARYFDEHTQQTFEKAHAEGLEKGRTEGLEKGRTEGLEKGRAEGLEKGRAEEKAVAVIEFLEARGLALSASERERILATKDMETLTHWVRRAATIATASALFE